MIVLVSIVLGFKRNRRNPMSLGICSKAFPWQCSTWKFWVRNLECCFIIPWRPWYLSPSRYLILQIKVSTLIQNIFSPHYPLSCGSVFSTASWLELGSQVGSTTDHLSSFCLIQHTEDLSTMRAEPAAVIANSGLMHWAPQIGRVRVRSMDY